MDLVTKRCQYCDSLKGGVHRVTCRYVGAVGDGRARFEGSRPPKPVGNTPTVHPMDRVILDEFDKQTSAQHRKERPVYSGVFKYFPLAIQEVANCSYVGNEQHHPGTPVHWDRAKSTDEKDALARHLIQAGEVDTDGIRHSAKVAWRALANLEKELEDAAASK